MRHYTSGKEAFRWTAVDGMVGIGDLPGGDFASSANGVSADGSVVVGVGASTNGKEAFVWTRSGGMKSLARLLVGAGIDLTSAGWSRLNIANAISPDGRYVVGDGTRNGKTEAFIITGIGKKGSQVISVSLTNECKPNKLGDIIKLTING